MPAKSKLDYTNFNNVIKTEFPEFEEIGKHLTGRESNFVQEQMNNMLNEEDPRDAYGNTAFMAWHISQEKNNE